MEKLVIGILAHVDAGKTTLSESILYQSGSIKNLGRVDHKNSFLDHNEMERLRGITIFSKQAVFSLGDKEITILDTPGHVDFSTEMERTLQVLDYAILVINGADGVQGHTKTLWKLLSIYQIPVFLFINKMDQPQTNQKVLMEELNDELDAGCILFHKDQNEDEFFEQLAMCDEQTLERYLETGHIENEEIKRLILERKVYPCFFGSALKQTGMDSFLDGINRYTKNHSYPTAFGAKIFKVTRDEQGNKLTHMKITGGNLKVKSTLSCEKNVEEGIRLWEDKVNQIRIYSGEKYQTKEEVSAGTICAVTGLSKAKPGEGLGIQSCFDKSVLEPVMTFRILLPKGCDEHTMLMNLRLLEEEDPKLNVDFKDKVNEIHIQMMGEVQTEILKSQIEQRFGVFVDFCAGNIVYKETITEPVEGVGHFEPLRHYAEVHLLMEPLKAGAGLIYETDLNEDRLARNWQRLIISHLNEKEHEGVLTGSNITDMKLTLVGGKAHQKHTEGGDFREATFRAIRHGLMKAKSILLEPYYEFRLEVPNEHLGRAMSDIQKKHGTFQNPLQHQETSILIGSAPAVNLQDYQMEVISYTGGKGKFFYALKGYEPCHNTEEVRKQIAYEPLKDLDNPAGSVFCSHGSAYVVPWDQVEKHMHVENRLRENIKYQETNIIKKETSVKKTKDFWADENELKEIFRRTYGETKKKMHVSPVHIKANPQNKSHVASKSTKKREEYLLVDGYNIIYSWEGLKSLAEVNIDSAKDRLKDILCNYQAYKKCTVILVFDAYKVKGHVESITRYQNIHVVYTKEAETADQYIEKTVHQLGREQQVTVATSDLLEQVIILGRGGNLLSAKGLFQEIESMNQQMREEFMNEDYKKHNYLFNNLSKDTKVYVEEVRLGKKKMDE